MYTKWNKKSCAVLYLKSKKGSCQTNIVWELRHTILNFLLLIKFSSHKNFGTNFLFSFCASCIPIKRTHFLVMLQSFISILLFWCVGVEWFIYLIGTWYHGNNNMYMCDSWNETSQIIRKPEYHEGIKYNLIFTTKTLNYTN